MITYPASRLTVYHTIQEGAKIKTNSESFYSTNHADMSSDTAVAMLDWAEGFVSITNDNYEYCKIEDSISLNEIVTNFNE